MLYVVRAVVCRLGGWLFASPSLASVSIGWVMSDAYWLVGAGLGAFLASCAQAYPSLLAVCSSSRQSCWLCQCFPNWRSALLSKFLCSSPRLGWLLCLAFACVRAVVWCCAVSQGGYLVSGFVLLSCGYLLGRTSASLFATSRCCARSRMPNVGHLTSDK